MKSSPGFQLRMLPSVCLLSILKRHVDRADSPVGSRTWLINETDFGADAICNIISLLKPMNVKKKTFSPLTQLYGQR